MEYTAEKINIDELFNATSEIYTKSKELTQKIKSLKANYPSFYDELNAAIEQDIDLTLPDGTNVLYALISAIENL